MATQKEMRVFRENFVATIAGVEFVDFEFAGFTIDGPAFENENGDVVVVKSIAKKEGFDLADAMEEYEERKEAAKQRAIEKAEKAAARAEKAKEKLEKAKEKAENDEEVEVGVGA